MRKLLIILSLAIPFFALENNVEANGGLITVKPVLTENQDETINNYFNINIEGDFRETINFEISNKSEEPLKVEAQSLNAFTGSNGNATYSSKESFGGSFLIDEKYAFTKYTHYDKIIDLEPYETKIFPVQVAIPELKGSILGGMSFKTLGEGESVGGDEITIKINNEVNSIVAVQVNFSQGDFAVDVQQPEIVRQGDKFNIRLPILADTTLVIPSALLTYEVTDSNGETVIANRDDSKLTIVPKMSWYYLLPWSHSSLVEGEAYTIKGTLSTLTGQTTTEHVFEYQMEYEETTVNNTGIKGAVELITDANSKGKFTVILGMILAFVIFISLIVLYMKRRFGAKHDYMEDYEEKEILEGDFEPLYTDILDANGEEMRLDEASFKISTSMVECQTLTGKPLDANEVMKILSTELSQGIELGVKFLGTQLENIELNTIVTEPLDDLAMFGVHSGDIFILCELETDVPLFSGEVR